MRRRYPTLSTLVVAGAALIAGCSAGNLRAADVPQQTARVTVQRSAITSHAVSCRRVQWLMTVDIGSDSAHVHLLLDLEGEKPKPQSVNIDNLGGFTGVANALVGNAEATFAGGTYRITGTAQGSDPDRPGAVATAPFTIDLTC